MHTCVRKNFGYDASIERFNKLKKENGLTQTSQLQITDRMGIVQDLLDSKPGLYREEGTLQELANMLGLASRSADLNLRAANCALREGDIQYACQKCLHLVNIGHKPAWELCAQLSVLNQGVGLEAGTARQLIGFTMAYCHPEQVTLAPCFPETLFFGRNPCLQDSEHA